MRVILYGRVSTKDQARNGESIDSQRHRLRARAVADEHLVVGEFFDEGRSAGSLNRPELQKALDMLNRGEADAIMVIKIDRLSRNLSDFLNHLLPMFTREDGPQLISLSESIDTSTAMGRAIIKILMVFAELQRENTSDDVRALIRDRKGRNLRYCRSVFGKDFVEFEVGEGKTDARMEDDDEEQRTINTMIELREAGRSYGAIARTLNERNVASPRGSAWYPMTVKRILDANATTT